MIRTNGPHPASLIARARRRLAIMPTMLRSSTWITWVLDRLGPCRARRWPDLAAHRLREPRGRRWDPHLSSVSRRAGVTRKSIYRRDDPPPPPDTETSTSSRRTAPLIPSPVARPHDHRRIECAVSGHGLAVSGPECRSELRDPRRRSVCHLHGWWREPRLRVLNCVDVQSNPATSSLSQHGGPIRAERGADHLRDAVERIDPVH
jgi:hypothetical protein